MTTFVEVAVNVTQVSGTFHYHLPAEAEALADTTPPPRAACMDLIIPPGLAQQADTLYQKSTPIFPLSLPLTSLQNRILKLLAERGPLRARQLDNAFRDADW